MPDDLTSSDTSPDVDWLADLAATDGRLHSTLAGRLEGLGQDAWARRAIEAESALGQARAALRMQDRILADLVVRHRELEEHLRAKEAEEAEIVETEPREAGLGQKISRAAGIVLTDPRRAARAIRRRLPGGSA
ncbi:hypothetical protein CZ771_05090 [Actinomycetales bacterium JB111]|nr:hypothetical protein CZ771_05090 [Actinomycetales bacterium JB111]